MKIKLIVALLFLALNVKGQFRMVGTGSWSTLTDSTYAATVFFFPDLTGMGYLPTYIVDTMRVFTGTEQLYLVETVGAKTFGSAEITLKEFRGNWGAPVGQIMVYDPGGREALPQNPYGNTGATAQLQAAIDSYNARLIGSGDEFTFIDEYIIYQGDTILTTGNINNLVCDTINHGIIVDEATVAVSSGVSETGYLVGRYENNCGLTGYNVKGMTGAGTVPVGIRLNGVDVSSSIASSTNQFVGAGWLLTQGDVIQVVKGTPSGSLNGLFVTLEIVCNCGVFTPLALDLFTLLENNSRDVIMDGSGNTLGVKN